MPAFLFEVKRWAAPAGARPGQAADPMENPEQAIFMMV